jgi:hypothetical protein
MLMESIYIVEYIDDKTRQPVALLDERSLVDAFMSTCSWHSDPILGTWHMTFVATHYKKDPSGVLEKIEVLDYTHLAPPQRKPKLPTSLLSMIIGQRIHRPYQIPATSGARRFWKV